MVIYGLALIMSYIIGGIERAFILVYHSKLNKETTLNNSLMSSKDDRNATEITAENQ